MSDADEVSVIQKTIVQNLYNNEIVVCDVSSKNPNVMFELGMRLAFDKPTIIIKDNVTDFTFDTSIIEHIPYPRDLRFPLMIAFKERLKLKLQKTYNKAIKDPINYTTFLKNFGEFKVAELHEKVITSEEYILNTLKEISKDISYIKNGRKADVYLSDNLEIQSTIKRFAVDLGHQIFSKWRFSGKDLSVITEQDIDIEVQKLWPGRLSNNSKEYQNLEIQVRREVRRLLHTVREVG